MINEEISLQLHDRFSRGETLTPQEHQHLESWYAYQDGLEMTQLQTMPVVPSITLLQEKIETLLQQLITVTQQIRELMAENEQLRQNNAALRHQLTEQLVEA
ncbi:hypothetical protein QUF64_02410 [Anaerolineales bacterium HSG6]|nr:hypothetical protein [Anaerolineales bacterium HSG6]